MTTTSPEPIQSLRNFRLRQSETHAKHWPDHTSPEEVRRAIEAVEPLLPKYQEHLAFANSAIPSSGWEDFVENGWKTVYETGPTWHLNYGSTFEEALHARQFNDERLFGHPCDKALTFAILNCVGVGGDPTELWHHVRRYGDRVIVWKPEVWKEHATVVWGDSRQNVIAVKYSEENVNKLLAIYEETGTNTDAARATGAFEGERNPYLEIQIHRTLTIDHVDGVITRTPDGKVVQEKI